MEMPCQRLDWQFMDDAAQSKPMSTVRVLTQASFDDAHSTSCSLAQGPACHPWGPCIRVSISCHSATAPGPGMSTAAPPRGRWLVAHQRSYMFISVHIFLQIFTNMLKWISENFKNRYSRQFETLFISDQGFWTDIGPYIYRLYSQIFIEINIISVNIMTWDIHITSSNHISISGEYLK